MKLKFGTSLPICIWSFHSRNKGWGNVDYLDIWTRNHKTIHLVTITQLSEKTPKIEHTTPQEHDYSETSLQCYKYQWNIKLPDYKLPYFFSGLCAPKLACKLVHFPTVLMTLQKVNQFNRYASLWEERQKCQNYFLISIMLENFI